MSAKFERWKRSYNRKLSYYGVPENEHTDKMARLYFMGVTTPWMQPMTKCTSILLISANCAAKTSLHGLR
jgi:hypothetical protein